MPNTPHTDTRFELLQSSDHSRYTLHEAREISFILRQLAARRAMITAYYGESNEFMVTCVVELSLDGQQIYLDVSPDETLNARVLALGRLICATQLDKVKIQFEVTRLEPASFEGFPAFRAPLPTRLLRLQRREYFRLSAPSYDGLACHIPLPDGRRITVRIADISGGGIGVLAPAGNEVFTPETVFENCRLELPGGIPLTVSIKVCNVFRLTRPDGSQSIRAGCEFSNLPPAAANTIQRYILQAERDRKLREV
jgi:flagellar brake protein